jgi:hypothetical protein
VARDRESLAVGATVPAAEFDVREFARTATGTYRGELDLTAFELAPLSHDTLRTLAYLRDVERATMTRLRSMLITATHKDARVTAFLVSWAYEKYWIADALSAVVGEEFAATQTDTRESTVREALYANWVGVPLTAVHTAFGTVDEWFTQAAYRRVNELERHAELDRLVNWILEVKSRHSEFFEAQARDRLAVSPAGRRITRRRLRAARWPIGSTAAAPSETRWVLGRLFATAPSVVSSIDALVDDLPGQSGLRLAARAVGA